MVMAMMQNWEVAIDGIQIFLCLLILFFLIRNHRRRISPDQTNPKHESGPDFNAQIFSQTMNQQIELAYTNIVDVLADERRNMEKILQFQQLKPFDHSSSEILPSSHPAPGGDDLEHVNESADQSRLQTRIRKLATRGMSPKQIATELKTPLGEVELILSLQRSV